MQNLELDQLKQTLAAWVEGQIGKTVHNPPHLDRWQTSDIDSYLLSLLSNVAQEHQWSLTHTTEKHCLDWIARRLAQGSLIVEVGSALGCSAAIMANANPTIKIKSIDQWQTDTDTQRRYDVYQRIAIQEFLGGPPRSRERIAERLSHYKNIEFIEGRSPQSFESTDIDNIDLLFEDSDHTDPGLTANLDFWLPRVRNGGLVLLHDYRPWLPEEFAQLGRAQGPWRFPAVDQAVDRLQAQGYQLLTTVHSLAVLRKP